MLAMIACLPMLWPPSVCTCQLLSICGLQTEHSLDAPSDETAISSADSECHCTARIPTTVPQNDVQFPVVLFSVSVLELLLPVAQDPVTLLHITPTITSNSLFLQHCALIL